MTTRTATASAVRADNASQFISRREAAKEEDETVQTTMGVPSVVSHTDGVFSVEQFFPMIPWAGVATEPKNAGEAAIIMHLISQTLH